MPHFAESMLATLPTPPRYDPYATRAPTHDEVQRQMMMATIPPGIMPSPALPPGAIQPWAAVRGIGQDDTGTLLGLGALGLAALVGISLAVNYQLGKAMAPRGREKKWAWGGAIGGTLLPGLFPLGMAITKNYVVK